MDCSEALTRGGTRKRVKMRHLQSLLLSQVSSQVTDETVNKHVDNSQAEDTECDTVCPSLRPRDCNTKVSVSHSPAFDNNTRCAENLSFLRKHDREAGKSCLASTGIGLDLNADDVSSSLSRNLLYPHKNHSYVNSRDVSECESVTGPSEDKDPLRVWMEMKKNGFLSSSSPGGIPVPKQRGRKSKTSVLKTKIELAKREQVDRFTKIAAPSGLLNELNPGIINHVRNRKQVHSIIKTLVRSENESKTASLFKSRSRESDTRKDMENRNEIGLGEFSIPLEDVRNTSFWSQQTRGHPSIDKFFSLNSEEKDGFDGSSIVKKHCLKHCSSNSNNFIVDDTLALKLSSSTAKDSENSSSLSNEESTYVKSVSLLSVNAATVASQWLELLHEDIIGRLAGLQHSRKRVRDVIKTELPFLLRKEFQCDQQNDPYLVKHSANGFCNDGTVELHHARWTALFYKIDTSLSEEEKQLESWLNQGKEMRLHCEKGLQHLHRNATLKLQHLRMSENESRSVKAERPGREFAVQAAAASIYSTCIFPSSKENES